MSIISPKSIVITTSCRHIPRTVSTSPTRPMEDIYEDCQSSGGGPRKRRRLTHLSPEEKMMRRKLKNRVAAQTARDRKKALMTDMESQLASILEENKRLHKENATLQAQSRVLIKENSELKERLGSVPATSSKPVSESLGSAVPLVPLPQGQTQALSHWMMPFVNSLMTVSLCLALCNKTTSQKESTEPALSPATSAPVSVVQKHEPPQWWGPQQQSWNPSMNL